VVRLEDYRPCNFAIDDIELSFQLDPAATHVHASYRVRRTSGESCPLVLDGVGLTLERIAINGKPLDTDVYRQEPEQLIIDAPPATFTLEIDILIHPEANTQLMGLYVSGGRFCTQCEAQGFRNIAFALDRPDVLSRFVVRIEADRRQYPTLLSNGDLIETGLSSQERHFAVWRDPYPKPSYLFALVAGLFDTIRDEFVTASGRSVALAIHVDVGDAQRAAFAMDALKRAMAWDERCFNREYDLAEFHIVAIRDFNGGAMENKGLNIFNSARVLADFETATDMDFERIERVVAHEYFHNWTGNRVTLRDWFQLCLKEGLTVYREQEFSKDQGSRPVKRIKDVRLLRELQFPEDAGPLAHAVRPEHYEKIDNFYTATVYMKAAEIVRMLAALVGRQAFTRGVQLYFQRWDGHGTTIEQFVQCFEEESGGDLSKFFRWYTQAGTPHLVSRGSYDAAGKSYRLTVSRSNLSTPVQKEKLPLTIPLKVGLIAYDGTELISRLNTGEIAQAEWDLAFEAESATFIFEDVDRPPIPAILRGFCAPVVLDDGLGHRERLVQMFSDPDPFTRWESGQHLLVAAILSDARGTPECGPPVDWIAAGLASELDRRSPDSAFAALAMNVPSLKQLIHSGDVSDVDALFDARNNIRRQLANALEARLEAVVKDGRDRKVSLNQEQVGRRALKTAALQLLASLGSSRGPLIATAFEQANNMTDKMGALEALSQIEGDWFDAALNSFLVRWRHRELVVDKWFSVQAATTRDDALPRVRMLAEHDLFSIKNPNRVRSLYDSFGSANIRAFHAADGSGYAFFGEGLQRVDALNATVAARLVKAFESWRRLDAGRQFKARTVLEGLLSATLSNNTREMIERIVS
jgi:aminopeptidase N